MCACNKIFKKNSNQNDVYDCCLFQNLNNNIKNIQNSSANDTFGYNSSFLGVKPLSPSVTPIKPLPFSPSQFLNSPILTFDMTLPASTPVRKRFQKVIFVFFFFLFIYEIIQFRTPLN